ncbi:MAG: hypothetical protein EZS28_012340 [Streblomastix strix]|uniref:Uncharacterized protein n=1 Tax=Streblomastix strix TaxID=222440 RepID=A0A5J4WBF1_9EUKA|nr:MAG: hypothetical protein EZS28_012340 [Streblomastix strix]
MKEHLKEKQNELDFDKLKQFHSIQKLQQWEKYMEIIRRWDDILMPYYMKEMNEQSKEAEIASQQALEEKRMKILQPRDVIFLVGPLDVIWIEPMNSILNALTYIYQGQLFDFFDNKIAIKNNLMVTRFEIIFQILLLLQRLMLYDQIFNLFSSMTEQYASSKPTNFFNPSDGLTTALQQQQRSQQQSSSSSSFSQQTSNITQPNIDLRHIQFTLAILQTFVSVRAQQAFTSAASAINNSEIIELMNSAVK